MHRLIDEAGVLTLRSLVVNLNEVGVIAGMRNMNFDNRRKRDTNIMFAVNYQNGRTAYITISPKVLEPGDHVARTVARERQDKGEIPEGEIASVKRVR